MKRYTIAIVIVCAIISAITSCDKVSGTGILIGASGVNDRVTQSMFVFKNQYDEKIDTMLPPDVDKYSFMIGADSHIDTDSGRLSEMFEDALYPNPNDSSVHDILVAHLGDLADTQPEPYNITYKTINYWAKEDIRVTGHEIPFYPVVGNHDITHNGWAYFQQVIGITTFVVNVVIPKAGKRDVFVFMDTASGTHGEKQIDLVEDLIAEDNAQYSDYGIRNIFFFGHTNYFRGTTGNVQFSSTFPREETYYMLKYFHDWQDRVSGKVTVFTGHIHEYGYWQYGGVDYYNLDSMSERNSPEMGNYLEHVIVGSDGIPQPQRYGMIYTVKNWVEGNITITE